MGLNGASFFACERFHRIISEIAGAEAGLLAVLLDPGGAQTSQAVAVNRTLPAQIFFDGQSVSCASLVKPPHATANCADGFGLAPNDPTRRAGRRQVGNGKRTAIGPDDIIYARTQLTVHHSGLDTQPLTPRKVGERT